MTKREISVPEGGPGKPREPELLERCGETTQSIDLDKLFTRDVTSSGSFDLRKVRDISFGKLLEAIPIPTFLIDTSFTIVFANQATGAISEDWSKMAGSPFASLFPSEGEILEALSILQKVFTERTTQTFEGLVRIDGKILWCRINFRSIRFRGQRSVLAIIEDLTAEKKQLLMKEKYEQLVQIFPIGIAEFVLNPAMSTHNSPEEILQSVFDAQLLGGNPEFARGYGHYCIDDLKGTGFSDLFPSGDRYRQLYFRWILNRCPVYSFEVGEKDSRGANRYYEITLVGNVRKYSLLGVWAMRQDITRRKETEQALRAARDKLEQRVRERTAELVETNQQLTVEIVDRRRAEEQLGLLVQQLNEALAKVKTLSGLLPICASCKKIRDDSGYWTQVEVYVRDHSDADFTHSLCPDCAAKLYPEFFNPQC